MDRAAAIEYLYGLGNEVLAMKLGLEAISILLARLGSPHLQFRSVLIAGTNGKGSVAAMLESIAREAGLETGLYTSPHLVDIEERIRFSGHPISSHRFAEVATRVRDCAESLVDDGTLPAVPTFFEQMTAIAFLELAARRVDLAVVEVGLGGRLDATNVLDPLVSVITPVSLDHQQYLGESLDSIAREKAGIVKSRAPVVLAPQEPGALAAILERCEETDAEPVLVGTPVIHHSTSGQFTFSYTSETDHYERVQVGLRGRHQVVNALTAIHAAEELRKRSVPISRSAIEEGIARAEWPGRLELLAGTPGVLLDGAHNAAGAASLRRYLDEFAHSPVTLVIGMLDDKDASEIVSRLLPAANRIVLTRPNSPRAVDPRALSELVAGDITDSFPEAIELAERVTPSDGLIVVAGSLYLVGEARAHLFARSVERQGAKVR